MNKALFLLTCLLVISANANNSDNFTWNAEVNASNYSFGVTGIYMYDIGPLKKASSAGKQKTPAEEEYESFMSDVDMHLRVYVDGDSSGLVSISDVASLGVEGGSVGIQPSRGWAYVNKPVYLRSDAVSVTKEAAILGNPVTITATPVLYRWNCGDGQSFVTKDAGGTWPNGSAACTYKRSGTFTLSADITWRASYTVNGNTYPVDGTLTTTSTVQTIELREAEAVLKN